MRGTGKQAEAPEAVGMQQRVWQRHGKVVMKAVKCGKVVMRAQESAGKQKHIDQ